MAIGRLLRVRREQGRGDGSCGSWMGGEGSVGTRLAISLAPTTALSRRWNSSASSVLELSDPPVNVIFPENRPAR